MPGNIIELNNKEWYIGDSKMPQLLEWLEENGIEETKTDET